VCVFITAGPSTKLFACGGGGYSGVLIVFLRPTVRLEFRPRSCAQSRPKGRNVLFLHLRRCLFLLFKSTLVVKSKKGRNPLHHGEVLIVQLKKTQKRITEDKENIIVLPGASPLSLRVNIYWDQQLYSDAQSLHLFPHWPRQGYPPEPQRCLGYQSRGRKD
jgi:hypothetical protein